MTTRRRAWLGGLAVTAALAMAGCSSSAGVASSAGPSAVSSADAAAMENPNLDLGSSLGNKHAPDFTLVNQFGQQMSLSQFRGKVVLLGFEDSECTTVCPLTTQSMVLAKELLGKAGSSVQLLGVDANPDAIAVSNVLAYSRVHSHGEPVGLPDRHGRAAQEGLDRTTTSRCRSSRARSTTPPRCT